MKHFRERNPAIIGVIGATVMAVIGFGTFYWDELPLVGGGTTYTAHFGEAGGLKPDDEVRIAGLKVGEVRTVRLAGDHVEVDFRVSGAWLGDRTTAVIKIKTLLGRKNLVLDPQGSASLEPGTPIPRERTVSLYDVNDAFSDLAKTADQIDTRQLAKSFDALTEAFSKTTPQQVRGALDGLSALSRSLSTRDQELAKLLKNTGQISKTLAGDTEKFEALIKDGNVLLTEFNRRREAISKLLAGTRELSTQLSGLVADNGAQLGPTLTQLDRVTEILQRNQDNLDRSLKLAGPYYRMIGNTGGNGRWIDGFLCGLVAPPPGTQGCVPPKSGGGR